MTPRHLLLALLLSLAPALAQAQPADPRAAARALAFEANAALEARDYPAAADRFARADALFHAPTLPLGLARAQVGLGKLLAARDTYTRVTREPVPPRSPPVFARAVDDARRELAALEARLPRLRISVAEPPPGLVVTRDGAPVAATALDEALPVDPGAHEVRAEAPGHRPELRTVVAAERETAAVTLVLLPAPPPPLPPPPAPRAEPATVLAPVPAATPAPPVRDRPAVPQAKPRFPTWTWIAGGVGLAMGGAGIGFLVDDLATIRTLHENCPTTGGLTHCKAGYDYAADNLRKNRDLALAIGLGGAGAVGLGVAVVGLAQGARAPARGGTTMTASAWALPSGAGAGVAGSF